MKVFRYSLVLCLLACCMVTHAQQRTLTSTYPFNGLLLNPAYAGSLNILSVIAVHRKQWLNIDGAPNHQALTAHSSFYSNRVGIGLSAFRDEIGATETFSLYGQYAYKIKTPIGILAMGLQGGLDRRETDFSKLTIFDQNDPLLTGANNRLTPNFGTGLYLANPNMYAGISIPYILENKTYTIEEAVEQFNARQSRYYYITGGVIFHASSLVKLAPSVLIRVQEQNRLSYEFTGNVIFDNIAYVGLSVRNSLEVVFIGQLVLNENLRAGYAYDAATNDLGQNTTGSHEILVNYRVKLRNYKKDPQCPVYF